MLRQRALSRGVFYLIDFVVGDQNFIQAKDISYEGFAKRIVTQVVFCLQQKKFLTKALQRESAHRLYLLVLQNHFHLSCHK